MAPIYTTLQRAGRPADNTGGGLRMGVLFGVIAGVAWAGGDLMITHLTRRVGTYRALILIQLLSLVAWILVLAARPAFPHGDVGLWAVLGCTAVCHVLGLVFAYRAFEVGTLSIVSPISSGFAVVTAVLAFLVGEHPPLMSMLGAAALIGGVVLATRGASDPAAPRATLTGVPEALLSALAFGTMFWLFYFFVQPKLGYAWPLILLKTMAAGSSVLLLRARRKPGESMAAGFAARAVWLAVGAALADTLAWFAYIGGTTASYATVVTALASLFSVVTVILAWRFLRERLAVHQWAGVAIILVGIALVSF